MNVLQISFDHLSNINFAAYQNHVSVLRKLSISNEGPEDLKNLKVIITPDSNFAYTLEKSIDIIKAGETFEFPFIEIKLNAAYLANLTESVRGNIHLSILGDNINLFEQDYPLRILAYDQWAGANHLPELLSAFVTPNHAQISQVIHSAAILLQRWTGNPSFDEYQSRNPDRVKKQMAAIYEAIVQMNLLYASVPASFELGGQRVRLADSIFRDKIANCLDISLFYASCLEAIGLHPILIIIKGHAFVGAWLTEECFPDAVNDDPSLITKRMAQGIGEIITLEATCMNMGNQSSFDDAVANSDVHFKETGNFQFFIDVKRSRFSGIRPVPLRMQTQAGNWEIIHSAADERQPQAPETHSHQAIELIPGEVKVSKQTIWERKLLDLTLRNSLLNLRITKNTLQFLSINLGLLEDALSQGQEFRILPRPTDWNDGIRDIGIYQSINQSDPVNDLLKHEFSQKRLRSHLTERELENNLSHIYRSARTAIDENGTNTLYISLGLLKWFETAASEKPRYAPILLLPVEMVRKSANHGYIIRSREEDTVMNITLLEMLRQDFGINIGTLENLPRDDNGVDVKLVFNTIRKAVMENTRWDVEEQAFLGIFSFSKFILWNDIHQNAAQLSRNPIVKSLINGTLIDGEQLKLIEVDINDAIHPASVALPISTDSSQLQAVLQSAQQKSFVLHGPPGTGKSQTITNIIANALYNGKKVLFVASKKAALEVVEKRLEAIGIGSFCLELHSNKAKKSAVLDQLKKVTELTKKHHPAHFELQAERLLETKSYLGNYVESLHKTRDFGFSLFAALNEYSKYEHYPKTIFFSPAEIVQVTPEKIIAWSDITDELILIQSLTGNISNHPLKGIALKKYNITDKSKAQELLSSYYNLLLKLDQLATSLSKNFHLTDLPKKEDFLEHINMLGSLFAALPDVPSGLVDIDHAEQTLSNLTGIAQNGIRKNEIAAQIAQKAKAEILNIDADQLLLKYEMANQKWFLPKFFELRAIKKYLRTFSTFPISTDDIEIILRDIIAYQQEKRRIDEAGFVPPLLGFLWKAEQTDWGLVAEAADKIIEINRTASKILPPDQIRQWRKSIAGNFPKGSLVWFNSINQTINLYQQVYDTLKHTYAELQELLEINESQAASFANPHLQNKIGQAKLWLDKIDTLRDWTTWQQGKQKAIDAGLKAVIDGIESGKIIKEQLIKEELYFRLSGKVPDFNQDASQSSEIGILQRNIRNGGRATSLRKLFDSIPNLLPRLAPCMLMSPISVAQYFDSNSEKFDLVIFDEASQMPTCEAVGAIARGSQLIVVGDPKQMPPTNFFSANSVDEDNIDIEDMESILDDCLTLSVPSLYLLWHYRSKHESLIAFSNAKYYENKLLTFPSIDDITSKVTHVAVEGFYDKGKTRQNLAEGKAIVNEVIRHLSSPQSLERSMGIVTFSSTQQILIEDLLDEVFKNRPDLEKIAYESEEPLFIKNLENVQGDERDIILFSIGYGPDKEGKISLNFGPVNRNGGWRRLNVAVSRARYEMKVFSTLQSDQIDLNRTASEGVAGLKAFLAFAEKGKSALPGRTSSARNQGDNYLIGHIVGKIEASGYKVHQHIGVSDYKIDMAVVDPKNPESYLLGILLDGYNYYKAKNSHDREIVQPGVLHLLGWKTHKIWSADWWENPERTFNAIIEAIKKAEHHVPASNETIVEHESKGVVSQEEEVLSQLNKERPENGKLSNSDTVQETIADDGLYEICNVEVVLAKSTDDFFAYGNQNNIARQILQIVETEAPVTHNLLMKRLLNAWGIGRAGSRVSAHFDRILQQLAIHSTQYGRQPIYWKDEQQAAGYQAFRHKYPSDQRRDAEDLPAEEVANAVKYILARQISLPETELVRECAKLFGYARVGGNVENAMVTGIRYAVDQGVARVDGERVVGG